MLYAILPIPTDLAVTVATFLVALICIGLGSWTGARRTEAALLAGWGLAGFATVLAGTITPIGLTPVLGILGLIGVAGLIQLLFRAASPRLDNALFGRAALLSVPLFLLTASLTTNAWDDYSHWLVNLAYLCAHDHFPTLAQPSQSAHAGYPYGLALPGLAVFRLTGLPPEGVALVWNQILIVAAAAAIARVLRQRAAEWSLLASLWTCAALGWLLAGLAGPAFISKIVFSNMADSATGFVLAVLLGLLWDWVGADARQRTSLAITFALGCVALLNLRQANGALYGLLILGAILAAWRVRPAMRAGAVMALALAIILPMGDTLLWNHYATAQIPGGEFTILPLAHWRWAMLGRIVASILRIMLAKTGLFLLILILLVRALLALRSSDALPPARRATVIAGAFTAAGMIGFLGFTYLAASFDDREAAAAASFWRYMSETGTLVVLAIAALVPLPDRGWQSSRRIVSALVAVTLIAPVAAVRFYRDDLNAPVSSLLRIGDTIARVVPADARLVLLDLNANGFPLLIVNYPISRSPAAQSRPPRPISLVSSLAGLTPTAVAANSSLRDAAYVFVAEGGGGTEAVFGIPLGSSCSYLLKRDAGSFTVLARWPIGRNRWMTFPGVWPPAPDPACDNRHH